MPLLTGPEIKRQYGLGNIVITPFDEGRLNANSYDLTLATTLVYYDVANGTSRYRRADDELIPDVDTYAKQEGREYVYLHDPAQDQHLVLDMKKENPCRTVVIPPEGLILLPGVLYLATTAEYTKTTGFAPVIEGRSSVGRIGLCVHVTAGFGDDGFEGEWTLEMTAVHPLRVYAGVRICQIAYTTLEGERRPYRGKYQGQRGPRPSGLWKDFPPPEA